MNKDSFKNELAAKGLNLSGEQRGRLETYRHRIQEWNQKMNLTAITDFEAVVKKHFVDSLSLVKAYDLNQSGDEITLIDIGTGAGFPGIPLKITFPNMKVTLLDSLNKRVDFLNDVINELKLEGIEAIHGRAEDYAKPGQLREKFDLCVSRAVANLSTLTEYCLPYVKLGGKFISYKSEKVIEEMKDAEYAISILGGKVDIQLSFMLPDSDLYRNLFVVAKNNHTPDKYPRKAGMASKKPLRSDGN